MRAWAAESADFTASRSNSARSSRVTVVAFSSFDAASSFIAPTTWPPRSEILRIAHHVTAPYAAPREMSAMMRAVVMVECLTR